MWTGIGQEHTRLTEPNDADRQRGAAPGRKRFAPSLLTFVTLSATALAEVRVRRVSEHPAARPLQLLLPIAHQQSVKSQIG